MARITKSWQKGFKKYIASAFSAEYKAEMSGSVIKIVDDISADVLKNGDEAVIKYTNKFDRVDFKSSNDFIISKQEIAEAYSKCSNELLDALNLAAERIKSYHEKQMPADLDYVDDIGVRLGNIWKPISRVGMYVPGGLASYPSSVLMNAIAAKVAGVKELVMVVPSPDNTLNPAVLAAAKIAGVDEIYKIGGAQAIAALAYGTKSIKKVDTIVGPGNAYVAAAKRKFYGTVGIDMIAGPSEILVIADNKNNPDWIAADLLSQAEHDENARSVLIVNDEEFAQKVADAVEKTLKTLAREDISRKSWESNGEIIIVKNWDEALEIADIIATEHLELALDSDLSEYFIKNINNAGAIFIGRHTPEAIGDYTAGPSHVLPTAGTARFSSGLSVYDFIKRVSLIGCTEKSFGQISEATEILANAEGFGAHALSVSIRRKT